MKKCPPGVICIENATIIFMVICVVLLGLFLINTNQKIVLNNKPSEKVIIENKPASDSWINRFLPSYPYTNLPGDVLLDPYVPPLSNDRYLVPNINVIPPRSLPINISTNVGAVDTSYRQVGILTAIGSKGNVIPLMGRPRFTNRDKWQYYTMSDQQNSVKLPVSKNGKSCTSEYGCDRLYDGDSVYVEGINQPYKVTIYDNDTIRYLPFF
jgi:hypothetical protein